MADQTPVKVQKKKKSEVKKRALKSAPRKEGVPAIKKKKRGKKWIWVLGTIFVSFVAAIFLVPKIGTIRYGLCKTFVELHDPYPESLEYVQAEERGKTVILDYNRIDSFGQRSLNQIRCYFTDDPRTPLLKRVDVNGKAVEVPQEDPEEIKKFNVGIPAIIQDKPSLVMPKGMSEEIKDYRDE